MGDVSIFRIFMHSMRVLYTPGHWLSVVWRFRHSIRIPRNPEICGHTNATEAQAGSNKIIRGSIPRKHGHKKIGIRPNPEGDANPEGDGVLNRLYFESREVGLSSRTRGGSRDAVMPPPL